MFYSFLQSGYKYGHWENIDLIIISQICVWS